jgi:hypothetical protein
MSPQNLVLLVLFVAPDNVEKTFLFCKDELPKILEGKSGVIQIGPLLLLIDIHEGLSEIPKLASLFQEKGVACVAISYKNDYHKIQVAALTDSEKTKIELKELNDKINKAFTQ